MNIKLLAVDLDDTLLNSKGELSPRSIAAVKAARDRGVIVVLATGRMIRSVREKARQLGLDDAPVISFAGALVSTLDGDVLYSSMMDSKIVREMIDYCRERGIHIQAYTNEDYIYDEHNEYSLIYAEQQNFNGVADRKFLDDPGIQTPKVLIIAYEDRITDIQAEMSALFPQVDIRRSRAKYLDITKPGSDKGTALKMLMKHYGLSPDEVMAIGDNGIDVPLLREAGLGVAVGNALEETKAVADYIAETNDEDGAAKAIEKFILGD